MDAPIEDPMEPERPPKCPPLMFTWAPVAASNTIMVSGVKLNGPPNASLGPTMELGCMADVIMAWEAEVD